MLAVTSTYPDRATGRPPIVLVHGAANSAVVWTYWQHELADRGWTAHAPDLRGHGRSSSLDLSHASMSDYAADIRSLADQLSRRPVVIGWSMGGLVALMVAAKADVLACVGLEPSPPSGPTRPSSCGPGSMTLGSTES